MEPFERLCITLRHPLTVAVDYAKVILRGWIAVIGQWLE
jgi:hypothetical protein